MGIILVIIGLFLYFVPAIGAYGAHKKNAGAILVLNLFLGWTIIGWVVACVWAATKDAVPTTTKQ